MAKKKKIDPLKGPQSAYEVPLGEKKALLVWVSANPPTHSAYLCGCSRKDCFYIWGQDLAVKVGVWYRSVTCSILDKVVTLGEVEEAFTELCKLRGVTSQPVRKAPVVTPPSKECPKVLVEKPPQLETPPKKPLEKTPEPPKEISILQIIKPPIKEPIIPQKLSEERVIEDRPIRLALF